MILVVAWASTPAAADDPCGLFQLGEGCGVSIYADKPSPGVETGQVSVTAAGFLDCLIVVNGVLQPWQDNGIGDVNPLVGTSTFVGAFVEAGSRVVVVQCGISNVPSGAATCVEASVAMQAPVAASSFLLGRARCSSAAGAECILTSASICSSVVQMGHPDPLICEFIGGPPGSQYSAVVFCNWKAYFVEPNPDLCPGTPVVCGPVSLCPGTPIVCDPVSIPSGPWDLLDDYGSMVRASIGVPERVWISDSYSISAYIQNNDAVPHVVSVEAYPSNTDICSVASSGTSSSGTQVREHEYLLFANGTPQLEVPDLFSPDGVTGIGLGDFAVLEVGVKPNAPGDCEVVIMVTVDALFEKHWLVSTQVDVPPPFVAMGRFVEKNGCVREGAPASAPTTLTVAAGMVDIIAQLDYVEDCADDDASGALIVEQLVDGTWVRVAGSTAEDPGSGEVRSAAPIPLAAATHTFRVTMGMWKDALTWNCIAAAGGIILALLAPLLAGGPIGALVLTGLIIGAILAAIFWGVACGEYWKAHHTVTVEAISAQPAANALTLLANLGDQAGDGMDDADP